MVPPQIYQQPVLQPPPPVPMPQAAPGPLPEPVPEQQPAPQDEGQVVLAAVSTAVTVRLSARSMEALSRGSRAGRRNFTDTINHAIQLFAFISESLAQNKRNTLVIIRNGRAAKIHIR
jgi:hypothetical protein